MDDNLSLGLSNFFCLFRAALKCLIQARALNLILKYILYLINKISIILWSNYILSLEEINIFPSISLFTLQFSHYTHKYVYKRNQMEKKKNHYKIVRQNTWAWIQSKYWRLAKWSSPYTVSMTGDFGDEFCGFLGDLVNFMTILVDKYLFRNFETEIVR